MKTDFNNFNSRTQCREGRTLYGAIDIDGRLHLNVRPTWPSFDPIYTRFDNYGRFQRSASEKNGDVGSKNMFSHFMQKSSTLDVWGSKDILYITDL